MAQERPPRAALYARVSTSEQDASTQLLELRRWVGSRGWLVVGEFSDCASGDPSRRKTDPPGLADALRAIHQRKADVLVIFAIDRLVRSGLGALQLIKRVHELGGKVASYHLNDYVDTTRRDGELRAFLAGWFAGFELELIQARTRAGVEAAARRGRKPGRPKCLLPDLDQVRQLRADGLGIRRIMKATESTEWATRLALQLVDEERIATNKPAKKPSSRGERKRRLATLG